MFRSLLSGGRTVKRHHTAGLRVEPLDDRLVPSTLSVDAAGLMTYTAGAAVANQLTVSLDPATDTYTLSDVEVINAPGFLGNGTSTVSVPNTAVSSMRVLLGDASDALTVEATQDRIQVQAGADHDTIALVGTGGTLDGIQGRISVAGEDGGDTLTVNDQGAAAGKGYVLTASSLNRAGVVLVDSYGTLERVNLNTTGFNDSIVVRGVAAVTSVATVNAGSGDDTLTVANPSGGLDGILGQLVFNGQDGAVDRLIVDDTGSTAGQHIVVESNYVHRAGTFPVTHSTAESVVVKAGAFNDTFDVRRTLAGTPVTLNTGDGSDVVRVGDLYVGLSPWEYIQGAVTINGQAGGDVLRLSDVLSSVGRTYTVTAASVSRPGAALIKYATVESVEVDGTAYADRFDVQSTAAGTSVTLRAGSGNDGLYVGSNPSNPVNSTLDKIQGTLTLDAGLGHDGIGLYDGANRIGQTFTVTATSVSRSGMAPVTYRFQDSLSAFQDGVSLYAGGFNDVMNVRTTTASTQFHLDLGQGDDTANVGNPNLLTGTTLGGIQGNLRIDLRDGHDVVNLNDQQAGVFVPLDPTGQSYTVLPNSLSRSGTAYINYLSAEDVVLNASRYDDTILVGASPQTPVAVNAGDGADTIRPLVSTELVNPPVTVNGQGGSDTLDYSQTDNTGVRVNLSLGTATGVAALSGVENATGGWGNDVLIGDAADNVLRGGFGRDLLIGREGADHLFGDAGEDILIGNSTVYDADPAALEAIMAEWRFLPPYAQRIQNLKLGGGLNGAVRLDLTKLVEDGAQDRLTGGGDALDWFFLGGIDLAADLNQPAFEQVN